MNNPTDKVNEAIRKMCDAAVKAVDISGITDNRPEIQIQNIIKDEIATCANRIREYLEEYQADLKRKEPQHFNDTLKLNCNSYDIKTLDDAINHRMEEQIQRFSS